VVKKEITYQFLRFLIAGTSVTLLDLSIVTGLTFVFKIYEGPMVVLFNTMSFSIAVCCSYMASKYFIFRDKSKADVKQFSSFISIALVGILINNTALYFFVDFSPLRIFLQESALIATAKLLATSISMFWSFFGYKFFIFKK
jgi:putative flippase GtrA